MRADPRVQVVLDSVAGVAPRPCEGIDGTAVVKKRIEHLPGRTARSNANPLRCRARSVTRKPATRPRFRCHRTVSADPHQANLVDPLIPGAPQAGRAAMSR